MNNYMIEIKLNNEIIYAGLYVAPSYPTDADLLDHIKDLDIKEYDSWTSYRI